MFEQNTGGERPKRPNVEDVLEINVRLENTLTQDEQNILNEKLASKVQRATGIVTIPVEPIGDKNLEVIIRNAYALNRISAIKSSVDYINVAGDEHSNTTLGEYNVLDSTISISRRRIVYNEDRPLLFRGDHQFTIAVNLHEDVKISNHGLDSVQKEKRRIVKEIDRKSSIRVSDAHLRAYEGDGEASITSLMLSTQEDTINLSQFEIVSDILKDSDLFNFDISTVSVTKADELN